MEQNEIKPPTMPDALITELAIQCVSRAKAAVSEDRL